MKEKGQKVRPNNLKGACRFCPPFDGENSGMRKHKRIVRRRDRHVDKQKWTKEIKA